MGLFTQMVYGKYKSSGIMSGRKEYWQSKTSGIEYQILNEEKAVSPMECYDIQKKMLSEEISRGKNAKQFEQASKFFLKANESIKNINDIIDEETSENKLFEYILEYFNSPLKAGKNFGGEEATYDKVTKGQLERGEELNNIITQIINKNKIGGIPTNLVAKLQQMIEYTNTHINGEGVVDKKSNYRQIKAFEVEQLALAKLQSDVDTEKIKSIYTGALQNEKGLQLGEDIMTIDIDLFNRYVSKGVKLSTGKTIFNFSDLLNDIPTQAGVTLKINNELYEALSNASLFNTQVKSGIEQEIYNRENSIYKNVKLEDLTNKHNFELLQQLREWDSGLTRSSNYKRRIKDSKWSGAGRVNKHGKAGKKVQDTTFFKTNPNSKILNSMANLSLSKDIIKLNFFRTKEYQLYFTEKGFVTLPEYLKDKHYIWMFAYNIDYRAGFLTDQRQVLLKNAISQKKF